MKQSNTRPPSRWRHLAWAVLCCAPLAFAHCGSVPADPDADVGADAVPAPDGPMSMIDADPGADATPTATRPSSFGQTAGGGAAASAGYRLELRIGAPQPMGAGQSAGYRASFGPGTY